MKFLHPFTIHFMMILIKNSSILQSLTPSFVSQYLWQMLKNGIISPIASFMRSLDNSSDGIKGKMDKLNFLLKTTDEELWQHFENIRLNP